MAHDNYLLHEILNMSAILPAIGMILTEQNNVRLKLVYIVLIPHPDHAQQLIHLKEVYPRIVLFADHLSQLNKLR